MGSTAKLICINKVDFLIKEDGSIDFKNVNKIIAENYSGKDIEVWDDLWFWGFITQRNTIIMENYN